MHHIWTFSWLVEAKRAQLKYQKPISTMYVSDSIPFTIALQPIISQLLQPWNHNKNLFGTCYMIKIEARENRISCFKLLPLQL